MKNTFRISLFLKKYCFLFFLLIGWNGFLFAQNIDFNTGCPNAPTSLADQVSGQAVSGIPTITAVNSPGGAPFTMSIQTIDVTSGGFPTGEGCTSCTSPQVIQGLTFTASGTNVTITGTPGAASIGYNYSVTLTATPNPGSPCSRTYTFNVTRKAIDLVMVLDNSGSMGTIISGGTTRWSKLKDGVDQFMTNYHPQLLTTGGANGDQIGIRMFNSTDAPPVNAPFNVNNFIPVTPATPINSSAFDPAAILGGDAPGGATAMGSGVLTGSNFLFPAGQDNGHKKALLVFTDGEQNVPPDVVANPGSDPTVSGNDVTHADRVQIHTIGLGIAGPSSQTLYNMAHESGGKSNIPDGLSTTPPDLNLGMHLTDITTQLLSGSSPQNVDIRRSNFKPIANPYYGALETFVVSKNIGKIFINLISRERNESQGRIGGILKDSQQISFNDTSFFKSKSGNGWQTLIINVDALKKKIPAFKSEGKWTVNISSGYQNDGPYILAFTVDDHNTKMTATTTQTKELVVGDKLPLSIDFTRRGKPITGATAFAIIAKPGEDLGNKLATLNADFKADTGADANNVGTQKLEALLKDSAFLKEMRDSNHIVNLTFNATSKTYVGEFNQLDVSGVYQVAYVITANDADFGELHRYAEESIYIRFPEIDLNKSNAVLVATPNGGTLTMRPIAVNGNYVGPGWSKGIVLSGGNIKVNNIVDSGNGTYVLTIEGDITQDVTISIGGDEIYKGKLDNIGKGGTGGGSEIFKQWWFWLIIILILLILWAVRRKKTTP
ncbi:MAG TPA: VWA domain-containing protein [Parafilimonas sp.]|nr:VWA domain-containing protein [Parafilimonas sp.]